jgi:hypothetical protein
MTGWNTRATAWHLTSDGISGYDDSSSLARAESMSPQAVPAAKLIDDFWLFGLLAPVMGNPVSIIDRAVSRGRSLKAGRGVLATVS